MIALVILVLIAGYLIIGVFCALLFVLIGIRSIDDAGSGASWGFKLCILPGMTALWPFILIKWARAGGDN